MKKKNNTSASGESNSQSEQTNKKSHKLLFFGLGALAVSALSYFGWSYWRDHSSSKKNDEKEFDSESLKTEDKNKAASKPSGSPHKTQAKKQPAKKTAKPSGQTTQEKPQEKTQTSSSTHQAEKLDAVSTARQLVQSATQKNYLKTVTLLNALKNVSDYNAVNSVFKTYRVNGVRQTLVNALLGAFTDRQKLIIKAQFLRIGLKHNVKTDKWSLNGIENSKNLITVNTTQVWKSPTSSVSVPPNMVLGQEIAQRGDYTLFENEQEYYLVPSADIKYYSNPN